MTLIKIDLTDWSAVYFILEWVAIGLISGYAIRYFQEVINRKKRLKKGL